MLTGLPDLDIGLGRQRETSSGVTLPACFFVKLKKEATACILSLSFSARVRVSG
jgi:hypothetical protein